VATFVYRDQHGRPYLQVQRTTAKDFFQAHWDGEMWRRGAPKGPKLPYRLPELMAAPPKMPIYITEGEGKAELLAKLGFVATSASLPREAPRLCRGGSRSLTFTAVAQRTNSRTVTGAQRKISGE